MSKESIEKGRVVCVGIAAIAGGKLGELYVPEAVARKVTDGAALRAEASAFSQSKPPAVVGAVYETNFETESGRIVSLGRDKRYVEMVETPAIVAAAIAARAIKARDAAAKAEAKAKRTVPAADAIEKLARIVAAGRIEDQGLMLSQITRDVQKRALELWRDRKGGSR